MERRKRGRPPRTDRTIVIGSASAYRAWFSQYWPKLGPRILAAQSSKEISKAIEEDAVGISASLAPFSHLILKIVRDSDFPRARAKSQIHFLADSLAGQGFVTPRRSREICAEERKRVTHFIIRREYYIECSCGYKGPALDGACRDCSSGELSWDLRVKEGS